MFQKIIITILLIGASYLTVKYRHQITSLIGEGSFSWISTKNGVVLFAVILFISAILYLTGGLGTLLGPLGRFV